jgi:hypothetical protein
MSKKSLLEEGSVRQFMKLANLTPLSDGFINEKFVKEEEEVVEEGADEVVEERAYTAKEEDPDEDKRKGAEKRGAEGTLAKTKGHGKVDYVKEEIVDEDVTDEVVREEFEEEFGEEEEVIDAPMEEPPASGGDIEGLVKAIADAISAHTGVEVAVAGDEEAPAEEPGEEEVEVAAVEMEPEEEAPAVRSYDENLDDIVAEVTKRVKKRLLKSKK